MSAKSKIQSANGRKWLGLIAAIVLYYIVHEGAHLAAALLYGAYRGVRLLGPGVQVVVDTAALTERQLAVFSSVGCIATLFAAYILCAATAQLVRSRSKMLKAVCYYATLALLLVDPLYLSLLYKFFGGGDMNGILLFGIPEAAVRVFFAVIATVNAVIIIKRVYPAYKRSFARL